MKFTTNDRLELLPQQRAKLRSRAHGLGAGVRIGKSGLGEGLHQEIGRLFESSELLKIRFEKSVAKTAKQQLKEIQIQHRCALVQKLGRIAVLYRPLRETKNSTS